MPSTVENAFGTFVRFHNAIYQRTNGWIGHRMALLPSLLLHTTGAKTGKARTTALTYARDGDDYLVVASNGGSPQLTGLVSQPQGQPKCRDQRGPKAFRGHGDADSARRPRS
ncbi:nitroreductase/quinone reductase family protein [Mycobacterium sp. 1274761.0]|uniref:nitroreductase/quinone reductase family protein n=1 Tax=Mycobacterium sp. 1274761.0 TaxID=1834077 RepID=UPI000B042035|nr:nitroreductase/quinone reductase family protein [Mycobacterium sp. 1274761.0]